MNNLKIKIVGLFLLLFVFEESLIAQNTDPLSYHTSRQLSDTSYSIKKANGDSTVFLFESDGNSSTGLPNLMNRNYPDDSTAAVDGGLNVGDFYRTGNIVKVVVTNISTFNYTIDNTSGNFANNGFTIDNYGSPNFDLTVNWGDGTIDSSFTGTYIYTPVHTYSSPGIYKVIVTASDPTVIRELKLAYTSAMNIIDVKYTSLFTKLRLFSLYLSNASNVDDIITKLPATVTTIDLGSNKISSFDPATIPCTSMDNFSITWNKLTAFIPSAGLPPTITNLNIRGNKLTSTDVNNTLVWLDGLTFNTGSKTLDIRQQPIAPPSGAGLTAIASLQAKGWIVTHD